MLAWLAIAVMLGAAPRPSKGSELTFHGWSPDSRLVAYTRHRAGKARDDQRVHRFVEHGEFTGFGRKVGADVERYARLKRYVVAPLARRELVHTEQRVV